LDCSKYNWFLNGSEANSASPFSRQIWNDIGWFSTRFIERAGGQYLYGVWDSGSLTVFLPPEQRVFPNARKVHTPSYYVTDVVATYKNVAGDIERQMSYTLDPRATDPLQDDLKIGGVLDGKLYVNFKEGI
jgi:hypothetical protein